MVSREGIEPSSHVPKTRILPLNYPEIKNKKPVILVRLTGSKILYTNLCYLKVPVVDPNWYMTLVLVARAQKYSQPY